LVLNWTAGPRISGKLRIRSIMNRDDFYKDFLDEEPGRMPEPAPGKAASAAPYPVPEALTIKEL